MTSKREYRSINVRLPEWAAERIEQYATEKEEKLKRSQKNPEDLMEELNADRMIEIHDSIIEKYGGTGTG